MKPIIASLLLLITTIGICYGEALRDESELKKKCDEEAIKFFNSIIGNSGMRDELGMTIATYTNHYNKKNNSCYIITTTNRLNKVDNNNNTIRVRELVDVNENKIIGSSTYSVTTQEITSCSVKEKTCNSQAEFDSLIMPYMTQ